MNPQLSNEQIFYYTVAWMLYHKKFAVSSGSRTGVQQSKIIANFSSPSDKFLDSWTFHDFHRTASFA